MIYRFGRFQLDDASFRLSSNSAPLAIEPKALRLLLYLVQHPHRLISKQELFDQVWPEASVTDGALTRTIVLLRKALQDDSREPRYIETVPTAGYRFVAQVTVNAPSSSAAPASTVTLNTSESSVSTGEAESPESRSVVPGELVRRAEKTPSISPETTSLPGTARTSILHLAAIIALVVLVLSIAGWLVQQRLHAARGIRSLAVLPLDNLSGDPTQDYFADGMTDELITELARIPGLRVVSRTSVMQLKNSHKPLSEIGSSLNVDAIVEGSIVRSGDRVRITAQLIDIRSDKHLWADSFEDSTRDILSLQDSVASRIASAARIAISPASLSASSSSRYVDPAAHDAYLRGRYFIDKQDFARSTDAFQQAVDLDPDYASAWAGLATSLEAQSVFGAPHADQIITRSLAAAHRAIQLDPAKGEAYTALGSLQTIYEWDWIAAQQNLTRGIELSPSDSLAEMKYSVYLTVIGRPEDAVTHMRRAVSLDPLSFWMTRRLGATLYLARHYDAALDILHSAAEMEPTQANTFDNYISLVYEMKGNFDEAVTHDLSFLSKQVPGIDIAQLRSTYQHEGWLAYWSARLAAVTPFATANPCLSYQIGKSYLHLGDHARALAAFNQSVDNHCYEVIQLKAEPTFDPLRSDPGYAALLARMHM